MRRALLLIFCFVFMTGCAQSMKQRSNMLDAMNGKLTPINYTKTYIVTTFGDPDSKIVSVSDGVRKETWVYKTDMGAKDTIIDQHRWKTRYMKITIIENIVTDVAFE